MVINTYYKTILLLYGLLLILFLILNIFYPYRQSFFETIDNSIAISIDEFNTKFDCQMITLPNNIKAFGIIEDKWYRIYTENTYIADFITTLLNYWITNIHPNFTISTDVWKKGYYMIICTFDGYRERIQYYNGNLTEYYPNKNEFENMGEIQLLPPNNSFSPILHKQKYILVNSKHINDHTAICIPDPYYLRTHGHLNKVKLIDDNYIPFSEKINQCIYRGKLVNGALQNFFEIENKNNASPREFFKQNYEKGEYKNIDYKDERMSIEEQLKFKYILDIDGFANTWDATVWKLYSGSVLLKQKSIWKQWYYDDLHEWKHYVPVENDFSDLNDKIQWCMDHPQECQQITEAGRKFVIEKLNWETVKKDVIQTIKLYYPELS